MTLISNEAAATALTPSDKQVRQRPPSEGSSGHRPQQPRRLQPRRLQPACACTSVACSVGLPAPHGAYAAHHAAHALCRCLHSTGTVRGRLPCLLQLSACDISSPLVTHALHRCLRSTGASRRRTARQRTSPALCARALTSSSWQRVTAPRPTGERA